MSDSLSINIDTSGFDGWLSEWMRKKNKTVMDALVTTARTGCRAFMEYTFPREYEKFATKVSSDISRVYATVGMVYEDIKTKSTAAADAFWYFSQIGKWLRAKQIMQAESPKFGSLSLSPFDGGIVHQRVRGARGAVRKGQNPIYVVRDNSKKGKLTQYVARQQATIGLAKAGWYECWRQLDNAEGAPKWVSRHRGKGIGEATKNESETTPTVTIHNKVRYVGESMDQRYQDWIEGAAAGRLKDFLQRQLNHK